MKEKLQKIKIEINSIFKHCRTADQDLPVLTKQLCFESESLVEAMNLYQ